MVKWWAGHVPPPHKTLLCFLLPQHTAGIPPKKTKRFHTIYRVRLDCRRKCIFLTCDYKAHVCSTQKTSGLTLSQLFMMHTVLYRKWLLGLKLSRDRNMYLLTVTAHVYAKWAAFQCASINIHHPQKLKWELWTPFQSEISKQLK